MYTRLPSKLVELFIISQAPIPVLQIFSEFANLMAQSMEKAISLIESVLLDGKVTSSEFRKLVEVSASWPQGENQEIDEIRLVISKTPEKPTREDLRHLHMALLSAVPEYRVSTIIDEEGNEKMKEVLDQARQIESRMRAAKESVRLSFKEGTSDKVYHILLEESSPGEFRVFCFYGRRASLLKELEKTSGPSQLYLAEELYRNTAMDKLSKGYTAEVLAGSGLSPEAFGAGSSDRATVRQVQFIKELGGIAEDGITKAEASRYISLLLRKKKPAPSYRQKAVLKFWGKEDWFVKSREEVSDWMDEWYEENPLRAQAWEIWKKENGDDGTQSSDLVESIPSGVGFDIMERLGEFVPSRHKTLRSKTPENLMWPPLTSSGGERIQKDRPDPPALSPLAFPQENPAPPPLPVQTYSCQ